MSDRSSIKRQIDNHNLRLQKLQEEKALKGRDTQPHILIEIKEIEEKITGLERQLIVDPIVKTTNLKI